MRDQGIFMWVGTVVARGGLPYRDAWDVKGPLVHLLYAAGIRLLGPHDWMVRSVHLGAVGVLAAAIYLFLSGLPRRRAGTVVAVTIAILATGGDPWNTAQPDEWAAALVLLALALSYRGGGTRNLSAGLLIGLATLIKLPYSLFGILLLVLAEGPGSRKAAAGGVVAPVIVCAAWLFAGGAGQEAIDVLVRFNSAIASSHSAVTWQSHLLFNRLLEPSFSFVGITACAGLLRLKKSDPRRANVLAAASAGSFLLVVLQGKYYLYQFAPVLACFGVLCGVIASTHFRLAKRSPQEHQSNWVHLVMLICVLSSVLPRPLLRAWNFWSKEIGLRTEQRYQAEFEMADFSRRAALDIASHVQNALSPDQPFLLWGFDAVVYVLADRPAVSRLGFSYPVSEEPDSDIQHQRIDELLTTLQRERPNVIVVEETDRNNLMPVGSRGALQQLALVDRIPGRCYVEAYANHAYTMYQRVDTCDEDRVTLSSK